VTRDAVRAAVARASTLLDGVAGAIAFGLMGMTVADVAGRYLFNAPLGGAYEITQYGLALVVFAALPQVTAAGEHVGVDLFEKSLPGWLRHALAFVWAAVIAAALLFLAWRLTFLAERLGRYGDSTPSLKIPLAPLAWMMAGSAALSGLLALLQPFLGRPERTTVETTVRAA
jgi:TRAP-type C4-dicarboxylate transport system permease small subunit